MAKVRVRVRVRLVLGLELGLSLWLGLGLWLWLWLGLGLRLRLEYYVCIATINNLISIAQIPLVASRYDTSRHDKHDLSCES